MKRRNVLALLLVPMFLASACDINSLIPSNRDGNEQEQQPEPKPAPQPSGEDITYTYKDKEVNLYRKAGVVDKKISLRFFDEQPNVPYIAVSDYFKEFFNTTLQEKKDGNSWVFSLSSKSYIGFNSETQTFFSKGLRSFNSHPDFKESNTKLFIKYLSQETTTEMEKVVNLKNYSIKIYENYVPFSFLGAISGGQALYDIGYNGKDVYVFDYDGQLGDATYPSVYGSGYNSVISDTSTPRFRDLADYNYGELCFIFDNLRGYTNQLVFGDNNLLSLGLNGVLEKYAPKTKEYLLSLNKLDYYEGLFSLMNGLFDGGHTTILGTNSATALKTAYNRKSEQEFIDLAAESGARSYDKTACLSSVMSSRNQAIGITKGNYYLYNASAKTSYIGFDKFEVDYQGWDNYYNGIGDVPVSTDTYAFVRAKLYQALSDGAENVVLDIASNGGGSSYALEGIVGLLHNANSVFNINDTFNNYRVSTVSLIDINLDGLFDEYDLAEANKFNFNIGILTSRYSFSCGNLLPSVLKELGYKILGERSGGGSCAIAMETTADGIHYVHSSYICLSDSSGSSIDSGVPVDFEIEHPILLSMLENYAAFFDFDSVGSYLSSAYN